MAVTEHKGPLRVPRDLDTRLVRTFTMVAREMSFTKAAGVLGLTQQGVSSHIRRLEELVGRPLFERNRSLVRLTEQGTSLLAHARALVAATDDFFGYSDAGVSHVRVAEIQGRQMMQDCWPVFRRQFPESQVDFYDMLSSEQVKAVQDGRLDVGMGRLAAMNPALSSAPLRLDPVLARDVRDPGPLALRTSRLGVTGISGGRVLSWIRFCDELAAAYDVEFEKIPHDNTMVEAIGRGQMAGEIPPILAMAGTRDRPGAEYFHFETLTDVQPYFPWRIFWRKNESRREVHGFVAAARQVAREQKWLRLLPRDVETWIPPDGEEHLTSG